MIVSLLAAVSENRGIGLDGEIPWHLSTDLKRFKALTMGHHVVMGRVTYESIGKPLPGRYMVIITRDEDYRPQTLTKDCFVVHSLEEALSLAEQRGESEAFVIGGAEIFSKALPLAARMYLTRVHAEVEADRFFPVYDESNWERIESTHHEADEKNDYPFTMERLERKWGKRG